METTSAPIGLPNYLADWRLKFLEECKIADRPYLIGFSALGWTAYTVCAAGILRAYLHGMSANDATTAVLILVAAAFIIVTGANASWLASLLPLGLITYLILGVYYDDFEKGGMGGLLLALGVFIVFLLCPFFTYCSKRNREGTLKAIIYAFIVYSCIFVLFPFMPFVRLFDLWTIKKHHDWLRNRKVYH